MELSTARRAKAKHAIKNLEKDRMMEEKKESHKMDEEVKVDPIAEPAAKMDIEEPITCELSNPCRVLKKQQTYIEYLENNRYQPILKVDSL